MKSYKDPSFQDRVGSAAEAKQRALDKLKARPPIDEAVIAERRAKAEARDAAEAAKRAAKIEAKRLAEEAKAAAEAERIAREAAEAEAAAAAAAAAAPKKLTDAEKKAARDARYAARKQRK